MNGCVEVIANDKGKRTTPSVVGFSDSCNLIGEDAKILASLNPVSTIFDVKRLIGRKMDDPTIQNDIKHWPFKVVAKDAQKPHIQGWCIYLFARAGVAVELVLLELSISWCSRI